MRDIEDVAVRVHQPAAVRANHNAGFRGVGLDDLDADFAEKQVDDCVVLRGGDREGSAQFGSAHCKRGNGSSPDAGYAGIAVEDDILIIDWRFDFVAALQVELFGDSAAKDQAGGEGWRCAFLGCQYDFTGSFQLCTHPVTNLNILQKTETIFRQKFLNE